MLKLLEYEAVDYRHWVGKEEFISMLGTSFLFPGLTAVKLSALIGYKTAGFFGMVLALASLNLPGLIMALFGYRWLTTNSGPNINKIMVGVQYGALALLAAATYSVAQGVVETHFSVLIAMTTILFFSPWPFGMYRHFWGFMVFIVICFFMVR